MTSIATNLHSALRTALRGTGGEDDQSLLLKLSKKGPSEQAAIAGVLREERDIKVLAVKIPEIRGELQLPMSPGWTHQPMVAEDRLKRSPQFTFGRFAA